MMADSAPTDGAPPLARHRRLLGDRSGVAAVEFALIAPLLVLVLLGTVTLFDFYRESLALERATASMSDYMSRQTELPRSVLDNRIIATLKALVPQPDGALEVRISSLTRSSRGFDTDWSYPPDASPAFADRPIPVDLLPSVAIGDSILVTETMIPQNAMFDVVRLKGMTHSSVAAVRPRFTKRIAGPN